MADKNTIAFSLSLAAVETIRQVGNQMERLNTALAEVNMSVMELDDSLAKLNNLIPKLEACRDASGAVRGS